MADLSLAGPTPVRRIHIQVIMVDMSKDTPKREQKDKPGPDPEVLIISPAEAEEGLDRLLGVMAQETGDSADTDHEDTD